MNSNYKIVVLKDIWKNLESDIIKEMLHPLFLTKKIGYSSRHGKNMLPIGVEDFFADHVLVCKNINEQYIPTCIFKIITSSNMTIYNIQHPVISMLDGLVDREFQISLQSEIKKIHDSGNITSYSGGFTINRELVNSKEEIESLKEIYCGLHTLIHQDRNIHTLYGYGVMRLKTEQMFNQWGITPIDYGTGSRSVTLEGYGNNIVVPISAKVSELSFYAKKMAKKYTKIWDERSEISETSETPLKKTA